MIRLLDLPEISVLRALTSDGKLLFSARIVRLFAYGLISVVLAFYLAGIGFNESEIGLLLSLTLAGDAAVSLWMTTRADRIGRRRMLTIGASLMIPAGIVFGLAGSFVLLTLAAIMGTISPSGNEVGPFLPIEQASLSQTISDRQRTQVFAWYNLVGSLATALGALAGGLMTHGLQITGIGTLESYRAVFLLYAALGLLLVIIFRRLSPNVEVVEAAKVGSRFGLLHSRRAVFHLSALFAVDAFAGGLVIQSLVAYWLYVRFSVEPAALGIIFFGANLFAGFSALVAARLAARFGLVNTMVFTHVPSNILLMLVPLMPTLPLAILVLLARFSISQMDVPTRQSYVMAIVMPEERSAAAGVLGIARTVGAACSPLLSGWFLNSGLLGLPFLTAGALKLMYDAALYRSFRRVKPDEERPQ